MKSASSLVLSLLGLVASVSALPCPWAQQGATYGSSSGADSSGSTTSSNTALAFNTATTSANTAIEEFPAVRALKSTITGPCVNKQGGLFAVNQTTFTDLSSGQVLTRAKSGARFSSSRISKRLGGILGDSAGHSVYTSSGSKLLENAAMLGPHDMTLRNAGDFVFLSGYKQAETTKAGVNGDLWHYNTNTKKLVQVDMALLEKAGVHRVTGIEVSGDDTKLYVTSTQTTGNKVVAAKIFSFTIDYFTGSLSQPEVVLDIYAVLKAKGLDPVAAQVIPKGMKIDIAGKLFISLNWFGRVLEWNTLDGAEETKIITLPTVKYPSDLEFAGSSGTTMYVVGLCADQKTSCIDQYEHDTMGRAFYSLTKGFGN